MTGVDAMLKDNECAGLSLSAALERLSCNPSTDISHLGRGGSKCEGYRVCWAASVHCFSKALMYSLVSYI